MPGKSKLKFDEIGYWSEVKLDIIKDYSHEYSKILTAQKRPDFYHVYIDAFAGAGKHISKKTGEYVKGSPVNALNVEPSFCEYHFIDLNQEKVVALQAEAGEREDVYLYEGDCNSILLKDVFPKVRYSDFKRGLCLLDPYGLHLDWEVIKTAGEMKSIEIFLNFPVADINRNVLWRNPDGVDVADIKRMNAFWGDESWRDIAYTNEGMLFPGFEKKTDNETVAEGFRKRLHDVGGFGYVPKPLPMRNSTGAIVYYLFFASQKPVAKDIIEHIFSRYRKRGAS